MHIQLSVNLKGRDNSQNIRVHLKIMPTEDIVCGAEKAIGNVG
jgi:hypothetical protein